MNKKPLVSVVVVTFNSEKFVFDTLESVKGQTYQNIELIITDDSSTDNTVAICSKWISENKERFTGVRLITSDFNTGITANRNRGFFAANGDWIKHVDGDDLLLPSCVQDYVEFVLNNPTKDIVFSNMNLFAEDDCLLKPWGGDMMRTHYHYVFNLNSQDFKILLCKVCPFPAPTLFIKTSFFKEMHGFDESIRDLEDWIFWVKSAFSGAEFGYLITSGVNYRISSSSLSQQVNGPNLRYIDALRQERLRIINYMKKISPLYGLDGLIMYKNTYDKKLFWSILFYFRPFNPFFWKARKIYKEYLRS